MFFNLINLIVLILNIQKYSAADSICSIITNAVFCNNFDSFADIVFEKNVPNITSITLIPNDKLILNADLNLDKLIVEKNFEFILSNLKGIELAQDPFGNQNIKNYAQLYLSNTIFDLYNENELISNQKCVDLLGEFEINLIVLSNFFSLKENIKYENKLCPVLFQESNLNTFELYDLKQDNKLVFEDVDAKDLESVIFNLNILDSVFYLDNSLLHKDVFKMTQNINISNTNLTGIQENLFQNFTFLKYLQLELNNFQEFIQTDQNWMISLNPNPTEMYIKLTDLKKQYTYSDKDFCLFKNFPHEKLVFPIINTKSDLECSCTLLWLLQYNKQALNNSLLITDSTRNCINRPDFDNAITNCRFQQRIYECNRPESKCTFINNEIKCNNFTSFSELNFTDVPGTYDSIGLFPNEALNLDSSLNFQTLSFSNGNFTARLNKINKFNMENNPFVLLGLTNGSIYLNESTLDFYNANKFIETIEECDLINRNELFVAFFDCFKMVSFEEDIKYPISFCPVHFKNANLDLIQVYNLKNDNKLNFMQLIVNDSISDLNCKVNKFTIYESDIYLNDKLFYVEIFKFVQELNIIASKLNGIQNDLFKNFQKLKQIVFEITNFKQFVGTNTGWMSYLNGNITVNLNDSEDLFKNKNNIMLLTLTDDYSVYTYPDQDFCLFQNFPHDKLVFPIINTLPNLECSCTLLWLIQYKDIYPETFSLMNTSSVFNCINRLDFKDLIQKCNFKTKIDVCNGITTTTTTTTKATKSGSSSSSLTTENNLNSTTSASSNSDQSLETFKALSIAFIVLTCILTLILGFALFIIIKNRISIFGSFKTNNQESNELKDILVD